MDSWGRFVTEEEEDYRVAEMEQMRRYLDSLLLLRAKDPKFN